jgi:hypothetical protein
MWIKIGAFFAVTITAIAVLHYCLNIEFRDSATIIGTNFTAISIYLAFISIRETHEWNRRNLTLQLMGNWNQQTRSHLDVIISEFPNFSIRPKSASSDEWATNPEWVHPQWSIDEGRANLIVSSLSNPRGELKDKEIYRSLISLLNYFESLASAYENSVVDRTVIEQSFAPMIIDISRYFRPFIKLKRDQAGREPWPPLAKAVDSWESEHFRKKAEEDAIEAIEKAKKASELAESNKLKGKGKTGV